MKEMYLKPCLIFMITAIIIVGCSKEESEPSNPTNDKTTAVFNSSITYGTMTDQEGNIYKTVTIGAQTWMAENLRTTKYNDGTDIPKVRNNTDWKELTTGAYCNIYNTNITDTISTFGRLFNWYVVKTGKLCPEGWHVPTDAEWTELIDFLGGDSAACGKLKETGTSHWFSPNTGATNESGFTALPGSLRSNSGLFGLIGFDGRWWSASEYSTNDAWYRSIGYSYIYVQRHNREKQVGLSVRCVRD